MATPIHNVSRSIASWRLEHLGPLEDGLQARFTLANGLVGLRLARLADPDARRDRPTTLIAGLFDRTDRQEMPKLAGVPDRMAVSLKVDGRHLDLTAGDALRTSLHMRRSLAVIHWRAPAGGAVRRFRSLHFVSIADRPVEFILIRFDFAAAADVTLETRWMGEESSLARERRQPGLSVWRGRSSGIGLARATRARLRVDGQDLAPYSEDDHGESWRWRAEPGHSVHLQQISSYARGDPPPGDAAQCAEAALKEALKDGARPLVARHMALWRERWRRSDVDIEGDAAAQRALRFALYHLNSAANPNDTRVSIGARGLTGDVYSGHVFWDTEIFLSPFYTLTWPEAARALLTYRYRCLDAARAKAARLGWKGAFYAWESADTGDEVAPSHGANASGEEVEILSGCEAAHISADVARAVWRYWRATED
ncbi:MAG: hypothetical protein ACREEB_13060, partial [Caulobacteraceae bacterium]